MVYRRLHLERLKLLRRLGRRGMLLLLFGTAWMLVGITGIIFPQDRFSSPGIGPDMWLQILDGRELNLFWIVSGVIAFTIGALHDRRIINRHEALGWNAILTMPLVWMVCFIWSFAAWVNTDGEAGRANGLYGFIVWLVISFVIMIIAGWPEENFATSITPAPGSTHNAEDIEDLEAKEG
jgi:hypothetical protein